MSHGQIPQSASDDAGLLKKDSPQARLTAALACHQQGQLPRAEQLYEDLLCSHPDHFDAWCYLGIARCQRRGFKEGVAAFEAAIMLRPAAAEAHASLGRAHKELGDFLAAIVSLQQACILRPGYSEAFNDLGICQAGLNCHEEALTSYERALALKPNYVEAIYNTGNALIALRRHEDALRFYDRALLLQPNLLQAIHNRGNVLRELKRYGEALQCYQRVLQFRPDYPEVLAGCAKMLEILHRLDEALIHYRRAIELKPDYAEALVGAGYVLYRLFRHEEALQCYQLALQADADFPYVAGMELFVSMSCGHWHDYTERQQRVLRGVREGKPCTTPMALVATTDLLTEQSMCAENWVATGYAPAAVPLWTGEIYAHQRIRVSYLSADFHHHATSILMAGLFERHDKQQFEAIAISYGPSIKDAMRTRLVNAFDRFIDVSTQSDVEIARLLRTLEVDIAVDLKGYTADSRPGILAYRPAPVQVSYLGYPGSMGAQYIDYVLADRVVIPEAHQLHYSERVVYLPDSYQVNDNQRVIASRCPDRSAVGLPEAGFVFCCFNNSFKITPLMFDVWMRLLTRIPGSVLWLLQDNAAFAANLRREAQVRGVDPQRLVFAPRLELDEHLARHQLADLFLDTLPYNAHTTASDALWSGLPMITCLGGTFAGRVGASLLHAMGLSDLVAESLEAYETLALDLANNPTRLQQLTAKLTRLRNIAPLFDTERFKHHIESVYILMWQKYRNAEAPAAFSVLNRMSY